MAVLLQLRCRIGPRDETPISGKELARQSSQKAILAHILVVCSSVIHALDRNIHQLHKAVFFEEDIVILPVSRRSLARTICGMGAEVVMAQKLCHISEPFVSDAGRQDLYHR